MLSCAISSAENTFVSPEGFTGLHPKPVVYGRHDMVVTNNPWASKAASQILKQGGNAVDASVAAAFVLGLTEPSSSGLGGGGFALTYEHSKKILKAYDGRETAPQSATPNLFLDAKGQPMGFNEAMLSFKSVGVPSEVALLYKMHRQQGRLAWGKIVQPAIDLALKGFPLSPRQHGLLDIDRTLLIKDPDVRAIYFTKDGRVKPVNSMITNPAYAKSLAIIAKNPRAFYTGQIARDIVAKINQAAGYDIYTMSDLVNYVPIVGKALCSDYRTDKICSIPFASGGVTVLELMKIYANNYSGSAPPRHPERSEGSPNVAPYLKPEIPRKLGMTSEDPNWMYHFLEASKLAYADRNQYIADPGFVRQPLDGLLANKYITQRASLVTNNALITPVPAGIPTGIDPKYAPDVSPKGHGTTSIAIIDKQGNAVSMTLSIEHQFGSHLFVDGFFLNNELTDFSLSPTDKQGKPIANRVEPLKRSRSAIAPAMVFNKSGDLIAISGSPGGSQIICYVAKNLIQMLDFDRNPGASSASGNLCAVNAAPNIETGSELIDFVAELKHKGEQVVPAVLLSGAVNIKHAPQGGWYGAADPRREGMAIGD